jgi:hypothetical protein
MANERQIVTLVTLLFGLIVLFAALTGIQFDGIVGVATKPLVQTMGTTP